MHILGKMQEAMGAAKTEVSDFAPRLYVMKINPDKIRDVIGKGGAVIRALTEETGTQINIEEDGTITIASNDSAKADEAKRRIADIAVSPACAADEFPNKPMRLLVGFAAGADRGKLSLASGADGAT